MSTIHDLAKEVLEMISWTKYSISQNEYEQIESKLNEIIAKSAPKKTTKRRVKK